MRFDARVAATFAGWCCLAVMGGVVWSAPAQAQSKSGRGTTGPVIPFEAERIAETGGAPLRLNQDSAVIPRQRIVDMPIVNGKMGEYVDLNGVRLHIPYGNIVSAQTSFSADPADAGNRRLTAMDQALGAVCAREAAADGRGEVQLRMTRDRTLSLVKVRQKDGSAASDYTVVTATETRYLDDETASADRLYANCLGGGGATRTAVKKP